MKKSSTVDINQTEVAERTGIRNSLIPIMDSYVLLAINSVLSQSAPIMYTNTHNTANSSTKDAIPSERSLAPSASPTFEEQLPVKIQKRKRIERTICISRFYSSNAQNLLPSTNELSHMNQLFEFHIDHLKQQESSKQLHH